MTGGFPVGTVCIGQNFIISPEFNGMECVVIEGLHLTMSVSMQRAILPPSLCYGVEFSNGFICVVSPRNLRRKQPPTGLATVLEWFTAPAPREVEAA